MKRNYWLVIGLVTVVGAQAAACSSQFDSCSDSSACASAGAGGEAGERGASKGDAGEATDGGAAGASTGDGGAAGTARAADSKPILFGACSVVGQLACQDAASAERLSCDGKKWQAGTTCASGELCDSATAAACVEVIAECAAAKPGQTVCRADKVLTCGADLVSADESPACDGACKDGACVAPACGDHKVQTGEECDDGNVLAGDGCGATCAAEPVALALGAAHSCALSSIGVVKCWGENAHGALGVGNTLIRGDAPGQMGDKLPAVSLGTNRTAKAISATDGATCALLDNGDVKCWGLNDSGQLGTGDLKDRGDKPGGMGDALSALALGHIATGVSIGGSHACAVLDNGAVKCWGAGTTGQLAQDDEVPRLFVDQIPAINLGTNRTGKSVSAGARLSTCAVLDDGSAKCWGFGNQGQLSGGSAADRGTAAIGGSGALAIGDFPGEMAALPPLNFGVGRTAKSIIASLRMSCAILDDDTLKCWGTDDSGALGQGSGGELGQTAAALAALPPVDVGNARKVKSISAQYDHVCVVLDDASVKCWGSNDSGQLGVGSTDNVGDAPGEMGAALNAVPLGHGAHQVATGEHHSCAILDDGSVKCWGLNDKGQLGAGDTMTRGDTGGLAGVSLKAVDLAF